jgi:hypothetical protein
MGLQRLCVDQGLREFLRALQNGEIDRLVVVASLTDAARRPLSEIGAEVAANMGMAKLNAFCLEAEISAVAAGTDCKNDPELTYDKYGSRFILRQAILAINIPTSFADREVSDLGNTDGRLQQLDGLRSLAALVVAIFHFLSAFAPDFIPDQTDKPNLLADTPFCSSSCWDRSLYT